MVKKQVVKRLLRERRSNTSQTNLSAKTIIKLVMIHLLLLLKVRRKKRRERENKQVCLRKECFMTNTKVGIKIAFFSNISTRKLFWVLTFTRTYPLNRKIIFLYKT